MRRLSLVAGLFLASGVVAQTQQFVRYEQAGEVSYGRLDGSISTRETIL